MTTTTVDPETSLCSSTSVEDGTRTGFPLLLDRARFRTPEPVGSGFSQVMVVELLEVPTTDGPRFGVWAGFASRQGRGLDFADEASARRYFEAAVASMPHVEDYR